MKTQIDIRFYIYMDKPGIDSCYSPHIHSNKLKRIIACPSTDIMEKE